MRARGLLVLLVLTACSGESSTRDLGALDSGAPSVDASTRACVPGRSVACVGPGGCQGGQECKSDGSGFDHCLCGSPARSDAASPPLEDAGAEASIECTLTASSPGRKYVANDIGLPTDRSTFAFDLNGDGRLDNAYGNIVGALEAQGIDMQSLMDQAVLSGQMLLLIDEMSSDSLFADAPCATVELSRAETAPTPVFDGTDSLTVNESKGASRLSGRISASALNGHIGHPVTAPTLKLVFPIAGSGPSPDSGLPDGGSAGYSEVPVTPVHVGFTHTGTRLSGGRLNGFIRATDLEGALVPAMAASVTAAIAANPGSSQSKQMLQIFDTGGAGESPCGAACKNPNGTCAVAGDQIVSICEISTNSIIRNVLSPDVQMFSSDGKYAPSITNTSKDSLSFGLSFTAVPATF